MMLVVTLTPMRSGAVQKWYVILSVSKGGPIGPGVGVRSLKTEQCSSA